jgi:hypothetical protein
MDFGALFQQFDTLLVGRGTFEFMVEHGQATVPGMKIIVFSRKLQQCDFPDVTIVAGKEKETVAALREKPGKDIWLFGGGLLFRSLLECWTGGYRGSRGDSGAAGRRDSAACGNGEKGQAEVDGAQGVRERDRVAGIFQGTRQGTS